jgi:crotonobetainyl-CoA:carnitine CoA-transferase CaiB-like acyl-CoA transferase
MTELSRALTELTWSAVGGDAQTVDQLAFTGSGGLASAFPVSDFASAAVATAALSVAKLVGKACATRPRVTVDRRLASIWFWASIRPIGWKLPAPWDPIAGDYQAHDGWIRLHTNAPHHRAAAERVLEARGDREAIAGAVARWSKAALENAVVEAGGCAAEMRSVAEWQQHPQGRAAGVEPLVHFIATAPEGMPSWPVLPGRPLAGIRVLDLTRVLAGPVASRFLAGFGADVLRIDPPGWDEPGVAPEVTLGKRCARLDLRMTQDRSVFERLLSGADILIHGYRHGALDGLGFDAATRRKLAPGLVDVCLNAYGWSGSWAGRRGFDSLVQMSAGIADRGMRLADAAKPRPLPVQALDHATCYLMAATAIRGVTRRLENGTGTEARLSLVRTAKLLIDHERRDADSPLAPETDSDLMPTTEQTDWGPARRIAAPFAVGATPQRWGLPARNLGTSKAEWLSR